MDRRDLFKMFGGTAGIPLVRSVEKLEVRTDEVIVITTEHALKPAQREGIIDAFKRMLPGRKAIVIEGPIKIQVMREHA
jgi:hypothetical protein